MKKPNDIFQETDDIVSFLKHVIISHPGRGAYNAIMASYNKLLQQKILEETSFLGNDPEFAFVNMQTRVYMLLHGMSKDDFPRCITCGSILHSNVASIHRGFTHRACSIKCAANREGRTQQIKHTKLLRHGDENYNNGKQISKTLKSKSADERIEIENKRNATICRHIAEDPQFKDKIVARSKQTRFDRHGVDNPAKAEPVKKKIVEQ